MLRLREQLYGIYATQTGKDPEQIAADCERNKWLDAQEMVSYGLADRIVERLPGTDAS